MISQNWHLRRFVFVAVAGFAALAAVLLVRADVPGAPPATQSAIAATTAPAGAVTIADSSSINQHTFRYIPQGHPQNVNVSGDFNGWSTTATPMTADGDTWSATVKMPPGVHYYKFVVDGRWQNDPASDSALEIDDNYGGKNSAFFVGLDGRRLPAPVAGAINASAVAFDPGDVADCNVVTDSQIRLSIRTQADDVDEVNVWIFTGGDIAVRPLYKISSAMGYDRFGGLVDRSSKPGLGQFALELKKPGKSIFVAGGFAYDHNPLPSAGYRAPEHPLFETPDWARHAVWYQIFPERFRNGDPANDPPNTQSWTSKWFAQHPGETGDFYRDVWARRYGGDIQGIRQELPYLQNLGITAIYLNPIFEAADLHKYDTSDYRHVDEHFGYAGDIAELKGETDDPATWQWTRTDRLFLDFLADAHRMGFKVIIDGVFNHVGRQFWAFQDVLQNGAQSKYASWFDITQFTPGEKTPFHYHAWDKDDGALPALKKDPVLGIAHGPREHLFAITRRWLAPDGDPSRGVDGFRLDAPEGIPHPFWTEWRTLVKGIKPDAYITGEIWSWAQDYLKGDQYDAVMNYQFAMASQQFFVNQHKAITPSTLDAKANNLIFNYPFQVVLANQNLFDSHDTDRVASMFVNPDLAYDAADRIQDNGPHYNPAKPNAEQRARMLQEVAWQMTFAGAPMIYYGDEAGMWSPDDPSDRQPMIWKDLQPYDDPEVQFDQGKFDWYQKLIAIRHHLPALQSGFYHAVAIDDAHGTIVYRRDVAGQQVYVAINRADHSQTISFAASEDGGRLVNWADDRVKVITAPMQARSFAQPTGRPDVTADGVPAVIAKHHQLELNLPAWGVAILAPQSH